jgi:hypothetical protein
MPPCTRLPAGMFAGRQPEDVHERSGIFKAAHVPGFSNEGHGGEQFQMLLPV